MNHHAPADCHRLEDLPNIGPSIASDLRSIGISTPAQLHRYTPLAVYHALAPAMQHRHDPCVLYTLIAARHFLDTGEPLPWWRFTEAGKELLSRSAQHT